MNPSAQWTTDEVGVGDDEATMCGELYKMFYLFPLTCLLVLTIIKFLKVCTQTDSTYIKYIYLDLRGHIQADH